MATEDNGKITVDLVWAKRPIKNIMKRQNRGYVKVAHSLVPTILRDIGPENTIDFNVAWESDRDSKVESKATQSVGNKLAIARAANSILLEERDFSTDSQRILNKAGEGINALTSIRKKVVTSRGALRLLLEILKLSIDQKDRTSAYDLLWAIEASDSFKAYELETNQNSAIASDETKGILFIYLITYLFNRLVVFLFYFHMIIQSRQ